MKCCIEIKNKVLCPGEPDARPGLSSDFSFHPIRQSILSLLALLTLMLLLPRPVWGQETPIKASVNTTTIATDELVVLTVTVVDDSAQQPRPLLPRLDGLAVVDLDIATDVDMVNGQIQTKVVYTYRLQPRRTGTLTIPPVSVKIDNETYKTAPISIKVTQGAPPVPGPGLAIDPDNISPPADIEGKDFYIEAVVDLLSREAARVKPGDQVLITQWGGDEPISGHVTRVEPYGRLKISALGIEEQRVNVIVGFDPEEAGKVARLGHGYQVDATVVLWSKKDALRVPIGALFRGADGDWRVFALRRSRAMEQTVKLGHINDEFGEVLEGLSDGEVVVLNPGGSLVDRSRIEPRN